MCVGRGVREQAEDKVRRLHVAATGPQPPHRHVPLYARPSRRARQALGAAHVVGAQGVDGGAHVQLMEREGARVTNGRDTGVKLRAAASCRCPQGTYPLPRGVDDGVHALQRARQRRVRAGRRVGQVERDGGGAEGGDLRRRSHVQRSHRRALRPQPPHQRAPQVPSAALRQQRPHGTRRVNHESWGRAKEGTTPPPNRQRAVTTTLFSLCSFTSAGVAAGDGDGVGLDGGGAGSGLGAVFGCTAATSASDTGTALVSIASARARSGARSATVPRRRRTDGGGREAELSSI